MQTIVQQPQQQQNVQLFDDEEYSGETSHVNMADLNFPDLMEQVENKARKIEKLRSILRSEKEKQEVKSVANMAGAKKMDKMAKKHKKIKCDDDIRQYVEMFEESGGQRDVLAWATIVLSESDQPVIDKLKSFFQKEKKTDALAGLENAKTVIAKLNDVRSTFNAEKIIDLVKEHDFLQPIIDDIINQWKTTPLVEITKADHKIINKIIKVFRDQVIMSAINFKDLCNVPSVRNEISDWIGGGFTFDLSKFKKIVEGSKYSDLFTIVGDIVEILHVNRSKIEEFLAIKISNSANFLDTDTVIAQIGNVFKNAVNPTDLQKYLYSLLNSNDKFAVCLDSAPGSGKSTGMLTNENGIIVYSPINIKSYKEMIISLTCAKIPFVLAQRNDAGELTYVPSWETMGKLAKYDSKTGKDFKTEHALTLVEAYRRLRQLEFRTTEEEQQRNAFIRHQEEEAMKAKKTVKKLSYEDTEIIESAYRRRSQQLSKRTFFSSDIKFVVCHPNLRENGALVTYTGALELAETISRANREKSVRPVTMIVDDFGANDLQMAREIDVIKLCFRADRIILSSGTCPSGIDNPDFVINTVRIAERRQPFIHKSFNKTLGLGVELNYLANDVGDTVGDASEDVQDTNIAGAHCRSNTVTERRFSLLSCDRSVFERSPTALQTITMNDTFEFLKHMHGSEIRNYLLDRFLTLTLDDLRQEVVTWVYELPYRERIRIVQDVIQKVVVQNLKSTKMDHRTQTLYLSTEPEACTRRHFGEVRNEMETFDGVTLQYLDFVQHQLNNYAKAVKAQKKEIESLQKRKTVEEGATTESMIRDLGEVSFNRSGVHPMFDKKFVERQLEYRGSVSDVQISFLLQKAVLLVDERSADTWIDVGIKKAVQNIVGYPIQMGIGVDMPKLTKVYLDPTTGPAITRQNMGRVGRSSQGCQGSVVFPNTRMLTELFDANVGELLRPIFLQAVTDVVEENIRRLRLDNA